jgi:adenylate cyclase
LLVALVAWLAYATDALESVELSTIDARFHVRGTRTPPSDVVFVAIDAATLRGLHQTFPFPRRLHGRVLERVAKAKPRAVAYDVEFTGQTNRNDDVALALAVADTPHPVFSATEVNERGETRIFGGEKILRAIGARAAHAGTPVDQGAVIRRLDFEVDGLKTLPIAATEAATGKRVKRADLGGDTAWIDYYGGPGSIRTVSFLRVLRGDAPASLFRGKVVVIGPSRELEPHPTPTAGSMGGGEIQATAIATALRGFPLRDTNRGVDLALIAAAALLPAAAGLWRRRLVIGFVGLTGAAALAVGAQVAFDHEQIVPVTYPGAALIASTVIALAWEYVRAAFRFVLVRFAQFVPEEVITEALARRDGDLRQGAKRVTGTVFFSDLRGFTTFAESLPQERLGGVLNQYLGGVADTISACGGTVIDYMGDGVMAVFGAPIEREDHADRAVVAAQRMLSETLPRFNEWLRQEGLGDGFRMGIGLNSGPLLCGNVGSRDRVGFTAIGDTTNVASRLEGMTKESPYQLFIADSTRGLLHDDPEGLVFVDEFAVRGRDAPVRIWSLESARAGEVRLAGA